MSSSSSSYTAPSLDTLRGIAQRSDGPAIIVVPRDPTAAPLTTISHNDLRNRVAIYVSALSSAHPPGAVVSIVMPNSLEFIVAFLAVTCAGFIAAPLNPGYTADEFTFYLEDSSAVSVIVPNELPERAPIRVAAARREVGVTTVPTSLTSGAPVAPTEFPSQGPHGKTTALFLHTSGTTSRPKGVPLTHGNLVRSIANICRTYELTRTDRSLLVMPLFHVHGLMAATLSTLASGGAVIVPPGGKFSASVFWPAACAGEATWYTAVPTMQQILLSRADADYDAGRCPKLRFIRSCSASLAPAVLTRLEKRFGTVVLEAYAMTEAAHQMTSNPLPKHGSRIAGSVGRAQGVEVTIRDEGNREVGVGVVGEVCIRGDNVTTGYHKNAKANAEAFAGGWFHTGDQGRLDEGGYLTLTGRIKELVNRGGEKISPLEVDAALLAHADVKEAVSFAAPDEKYGEEVNAAVIAREGSALDEEDLRKWALQRMAPFKVPKRWFLCDDLPRTATGKIQRRIVAKHFLSSGPPAN